MRTPREVKDSDGDYERNDDALNIQTEAVPYAAAGDDTEETTVIMEGGAGKTAELPLRSLTLRDAAAVQGTDEDDNADTWNALQAPLQSSVELTYDGLVWKTGGAGIHYGDMKHDLDVSSSDGRDGLRGRTSAQTTASAQMTERDARELTSAGDLDGLPFDSDARRDLTAAEITAINGYAADNCSVNGSNWAGGQNCNDFNRDDLTITFGLPSRSPNIGEAVYYWSALIPVHPDQPTPDASEEGSDGALIAARGASGEYNLWLSNYGIFDEGNILTDGDGNKLPDQGTAADDDEHRYLSYAAYGLFVYWDYTTRQEEIVPGRWQAFHFGYDAFADSRGNRVTDLAEPIEGTFEGSTIGHVIHRETLRDDPSVMGDLTRLRGDVELTAMIGGEGDTANKISGTISNLQAARGFGWYTFTPLAGGVTLESGDIGVSGAYSGTTAAVVPGTDWGAGAYNGTFYGPVTGLETGGHWSLPAAADRHDDFMAVGGAFGAVCTDGCAAE